LLGDLREQALVPAEDLHINSQKTAEVHTDRNRTVADNIGLGLLVLGICGAFAGLLAGYGIARGIARRIEQSEREVSRSEQLAALGQLAAGLAHELRNPLTSIRVLVEAGRDQAGDSMLDRRDLEVLDEEIARLEKLISSFLEFARPPQLEKSRIDVRSLIDQTLNFVGGQARQRGVTIDWKRPAEPLEIEADAVQLRQVLLNLLLNAMDAVGEGGRATIKLERSSEAASGRAGCLIHVSDNGQGVPVGMREKIFEPFLSSKETGLGLGLPVSRRIVEAHEGLITISENFGGGARFTVTLPITAAAPPQEDDIENSVVKADRRARHSLASNAR
jgi:signal transduction histidine kinase